MDEPELSPGFRFSTLDAVVLAVGALATTGFAFVNLWVGLVIAFVVVHFFLFGNIFRMSRPLELIWAALFASLAAAATYRILSWPIAFAVAAAVTVIVVLIEFRRPSYHDIGWRKLNPQLPEWGCARTSGG